ncbi:MAG: hypothetical protein ACREK5_04290 [Gemmatimonadota bacterium]
MTGRVVWVSPATLILDFGFGALRETGLARATELELVVGDRTRLVHFCRDPGALAELRRAVLEGGTPRSQYVETGALLANSMTLWDDPEVYLLWLMPLVGEPYREDPKLNFLMSYTPQPGTASPGGVGRVRGRAAGGAGRGGAGAR